MIDNDDVSDWILFINPTTLPGFVVWVVGIVVLWFCLLDNEADCSRLQCHNGATPQIMAHECLCVEHAR